MCIARGYEYHFEKNLLEKRYIKRRYKPNWVYALYFNTFAVQLMQKNTQYNF